MSKYAEMMEDFEARDNEEINTAETAYYIQVQSRISQKLLEAATISALRKFEDNCK